MGMVTASKAIKGSARAWQVGRVRMTTLSLFKEYRAPLQMRNWRLRSPAFSSTTAFRDHHSSTWFSAHGTPEFAGLFRICHFIIACRWVSTLFCRWNLRLKEPKDSHLSLASLCRDSSIPGGKETEVWLDSKPRSLYAQRHPPFPQTSSLLGRVGIHAQKSG